MVLLSSNSAWPNADGVGTDSSQGTQSQCNKIAEVGSRVVKNTTRNQYRMESVYPEQSGLQFTFEP